MPRAVKIKTCQAAGPSQKKLAEKKPLVKALPPIVEIGNIGVLKLHRRTATVSRLSVATIIKVLEDSEFIIFWS